MHAEISTRRAIGGLLAAAVTSGMFVASALGSAPAANATCASFWGFGNGNGCTSTFGGVAIAIGTGASAYADGFLATAITIGNDSGAGAWGNLNYASNVGTGGSAVAGDGYRDDFGNVAISFGDHSYAEADNRLGQGFGNIALNLGNGSAISADGILNTVSNTGDDNDVGATGIANSASNFGGTGNLLQAYTNVAGAVGLNRAFAIFSNKTHVTAFKGPFATAGSVLQTGAIIKLNGPGININGISIGGAAAPAQKGAPAVSVKSAAGSRQAHAATASTKHTSKK
jgi:hypothetical protein